MSDTDTDMKNEKALQEAIERGTRAWGTPEGKNYRAELSREQFYALCDEHLKQARAKHPFFADCTSSYLEAIEIAKRYNWMIERDSSVYIQNVSATARPARVHDFWDGRTAYTKEELKIMDDMRRGEEVQE